MAVAVSGEQWLHPTFLGIGAPKAGTTSLVRLLETHPDVVMSPHRKEIHYFDLHFDQGPGWYERFFPAGDRRQPPLAVGEFTPHYLYDARVASRVRSVPTVDRFVLVLRNPVDRAFSHYRFRVRQDDLRVSFDEFLRREPNAIEWGRYGHHLGPWLDQHDHDRFLLLVHERAFAEPSATAAAVAQHLGVDPGRFPHDAPPRANESFTPKRRRLYAVAVRRARWLRAHRLDRVITAAKRAGVVDALKRRDTVGVAPALERDQRLRLWERFAADVDRLASLTGLDLSHWEPTTGEA